MELVIPHQASLMAMKLTQKNLNISEGKFLYTIGHHGNTVAASIPMALYDAIESGRIKRGDKIMFLGTSAGMSVGAMAFEY
jgi:3-oxoacyl-[acyl-carrier-protein] synthase-3